MKLKKSLPLSFIFLFVLIFTTQTVFAKSYRIRSSDNISRIVDKFYANRSLSKQQIMVGVLTRNPRAFKGGNVNFLLRGRRIQLPKESEMSAVSDVDAKVVLSRHNYFFRRGLTGAGKLPKLGASSKIAVAKVIKAEKLKQQPASEKTQAEQIEKIKRLEAESKALKLQLDRLLEARKERDKKLLELERSINQSLEEEEKKKDSDSSLEALTKELKERNSFLQQKLRETRSQLAENSLSKISLERRFNDLKNPVTKSVITENDNDTNTVISAKNSNSVLISKESSSPQLMFKVEEWKQKILGYQSSLGGVFWVIPAILLLLAGFILKRLFGGKRKDEDDGVDYATQISDAEAIDYLQNNQDDIHTNYDDELDASIKLDVARAYIEADEMESASNILEEVLAEGTDELKIEAKKIMANLKAA